jgi:zinc/manganese transport system permease protein
MTIELAALSLDPVSDWNQLTTYPFMVQALEAGTIVAAMAGVIGWLMVLRRQAFAGHTLAVIAFPGAAAAALAGLPLALGYYGFCGLGAVALAAASREETSGRSSESAAIGTVQALALGAGFVFVTLYNGQLGDLQAMLFGTFLGITAGQVLTLLWIALGALAILGLVGRPLLFASVDPAVARARGVPARLLDAGFLLVLGLAVAATAQITGALLVFALLVTPAATAQRLTGRPGAGIALSAAFALVVTWFGLVAAYFSPYPVGFWVTSAAFGLYVIVRILTPSGRLRRAHAPGAA